MKTDQQKQLFSQKLKDLIELPQEKRTIEGFEKSFGEQGELFLIFILSVPFLQPIPLGISAPFGLIAGSLGLCICLHRLPWIPKKFRSLAVPNIFFEKILPKIIKIIETMEKWIHPRWPKIIEARVLYSLHGLVLMIAGFLMALPLPIPFSNALPAITLVLLSLGLLEKDGALVLTGYIAFVATIAFFIALVAVPASFL